MFFEDLPSVHRRRENGQFRQVLDEETRGRRPAYYLQNFHFQSGGWMTPESAQRYDTQVEVLFAGTANAIRRQALPPLHELFYGRDQRRLRLVDVGCGTGRALHFFKQVWPRLPAIGIDMSDAYVAEARRHLRQWCWIDFIVANGEAIPLEDQSQDAATSIFMFHELPPGVRRTVFCELARVLKRGGRLVVVDSLQLGDQPDYDGMLELFPQNYHEPYYRSYLTEDFGAMATEFGLTHVRSVNAFVSKVMVFDKV
jgi:ubiquinone/menaquinone biosynthesis C-methylase UbiE